MLPSNHTIGRIRIHFRSLSSTNEIVAELVSKINPTHGMVLSTDFQSSGKGQFDRIWLGNAGQNIAMSIFVEPRFLLPSQQFYLSKATAVAVCHLLEDLGISDVAIKWPNDVLAGGNKICGILIKNVLSGMNYKHAIVGIGLNILQTEFEGQYNRKPTSVKLQMREAIIPEVRVIERLLLAHFEKMYEKLELGEKDWINQEYHHYLFGYGKPVWYRLPVGNEVGKGILREVDETGKLCVDAEGQTLRYLMGEIALLDKEI